MKTTSVDLARNLVIHTQVSLKKIKCNALVKLTFDKIEFVKYFPIRKQANEDQASLGQDIFRHSHL